jgi:hypothetical protein
MLFLHGQKECIYGLAEVLSPIITKKFFARKSHLLKVPHLRKVRKSNKLFQSANFRICQMRNLFADRPPLQKEQIWQPGVLVFMKAVSRVCESGRT